MPVVVGHDYGSGGLVPPPSAASDALASAAPLSGERCRIVLLGSMASPRYVEPLLELFGDRLFFPETFVGRGDMSRGGLLLRCVAEKRELAYALVAGAARHGPRPPRLPPRGADDPVTPSALR